MKTQNEGVELKYADLLGEVHTFLVEKYSTITGFLNSEDFTGICGFEDTDKERQKINSYLSLPKEGEKAVQSFPTLQKIANKLMGRNLESEIVVTRTSKIYEQPKA